MIVSSRFHEYKQSYNDVHDITVDVDIHQVQFYDEALQPMYETLSALPPVFCRCAFSVPSGAVAAACSRAPLSDACVVSDIAGGYDEFGFGASGVCDCVPDAPLACRCTPAAGFSLSSSFAFAKGFACGERVSGKAIKGEGERQDARHPPAASSSARRCASRGRARRGRAYGRACPSPPLSCP